MLGVDGGGGRERKEVGSEVMMWRNLGSGGKMWWSSKYSELWRMGMRKGEKAECGGVGGGRVSRLGQKT